MDEDGDIYVVDDIIFVMATMDKVDLLDIVDKMTTYSVLKKQNTGVTYQ